MVIFFLISFAIKRFVPYTIVIMSTHTKNALFLPARVMCFLGMIVLTIASIMSYKHVPSVATIIPKPEYTVFAVNAASALLALLLVIFPNNWQPQVIILFIQAISTTCTGYDTLGTFLYAAFTILCFINGFFKTHAKEKIIILILIWCLALAGDAFYVLNTFPHDKRAYFRMVLEIAISIFFFGFYFYVYKKLESLLVTLVPAKPNKNPNLNLPKQGTNLYLSQYGLTERQINIVLEYLESQKSYEALGEQFFISKSTVKKDMSEIFEKFDVKNIKELHILLLQYIVKA